MWLSTPPAGVVVERAHRDDRDPAARVAPGSPRAARPAEGMGEEPCPGEPPGHHEVLPAHEAEPVDGREAVRGVGGGAGPPATRAVAVVDPHEGFGHLVGDAATEAAPAERARFDRGDRRRALDDRPVPAGRPRVEPGELVRNRVPGRPVSAEDVDGGAHAGVGCEEPRRHEPPAGRRTIGEGGPAGPAEGPAEARRGLVVSDRILARRPPERLLRDPGHRCKWGAVVLAAHRAVAVGHVAHLVGDEAHGPAKTGSLGHAEPREAAIVEREHSANRSRRAPGRPGTVGRCPSSPHPNPSPGGRGALPRATVQ